MDAEPGSPSQSGIQSLKSKEATCLLLPGIIFAVMVLAFLAGVLLFKWPAGLATAFAAVVGMLIGLRGFDAALLVEGAYGFVDVALVIACAMIFMKALEEAGMLESLTSQLLGALGGRKWLILAASMFLVMLPGMLTGSSTAATLTTGRLVIPVLLALGMASPRAASFVALASIVGMIAPPVNIPAMIIGSGVDMPYVGFELPLLAISLPLAVFFVIVFGRKLGRSNAVAPAAILSAAAGQQKKKYSVLQLVIPFVFILLPMLAVRIWPGTAPDLGLAGIFMLGALSVWLLAPRMNVWAVVRGSLELSMPILGILAGAGMFVEVMTRTGVRGLLVSSALLLPTRYLALAAIVAVPLFGAVSAYASASVLGVPFLLAMLGQGDVATAAAISALAAIGDLMPPIALVPSLSLQGFSEPPSRRAVIQRSLLGALAVAAMAALMLYGARYVPFLKR